MDPAFDVFMSEQQRLPDRCQRCHGPGERRATTRSLEGRRRADRCIVYVSSCAVCGSTWDDDRYSHDNAQEVERAGAPVDSEH
jgi:hypothetical protein